MTRILITNAYSARNRGDGAIVLGMIESLRRAFGDGEVEISVSSADHPADGERYPVAVLPSFHSIMGRFSRHGTLQGLFFLLVLLPASLAAALLLRLTGLALPLPWGLAPLLEAHHRADLVVACGGGYLYTTSPRRGTVMLLVQLHSFMLGRVLGRPVYLHAQSIGPLASSLHARLVRAALRRVRLVEVREASSARLVRGWGLPVPVHEAADAAFLLRARAPSPDPLGPATGSLRVGITVRSWLREPGAQEAYEEAMARFVERILGAHDAEVVFLPQVTVPRTGDDDRSVARRIVERLGSPPAARLLEADPTPGEMLWICGRLDCLVGTRMHSNIFALSMGVPVVAIAYQPKTAGIMEELGLGAWVLPMEGLDAGRLYELFGEMLRQREALSEQLRQRLPAVRRNALRAGTLIAEDLRGLRRGARSGRTP